MSPDDELCLCFHVTWRKVINFARINKVRIPSQLAECQSAGTGCGWCRHSMERIIARMQENTPDAQSIERWLIEEFPASATYKQQRSVYIRDGRRLPATSQRTNAEQSLSNQTTSENQLQPPADQSTQQKSSE